MQEKSHLLKGGNTFLEEESGEHDQAESRRAPMTSCQNARPPTVGREAAFRPMALALEVASLSSSCLSYSAKEGN